jgi:hypothetical protein
MNFYLIVGTVAACLFLLIIVFRLEKRMVWPYSGLQPHPHFDDPTGYARRWVDDAIRAGFSLLGWTRDLKGETYRVTYAMLVSPDRTTFAVIGAGSILQMRLQGTWLHTPSADGHSFYSTDSQSGVQIDISRHWTNQLAPVPSFPAFWQRHRSWIQELRVLPRSFSSGRELDEFRSLREDHFRSMERAGLIRYIDGSANQFQFTLYGAAATATWSYFLGLIRAMTSGRFPRNA